MIYLHSLSFIRTWHHSKYSNVFFYSTPETERNQKIITDSRQAVVLASISGKWLFLSSSEADLFVILALSKLFITGQAARSAVTQINDGQTGPLQVPRAPSVTFCEHQTWSRTWTGTGCHTEKWWTVSSGRSGVGIIVDVITVTSGRSDSPSNHSDCPLPSSED